MKPASLLVRDRTVQAMAINSPIPSLASLIRLPNSEGFVRRFTGEIDRSRNNDDARSRYRDKLSNAIQRRYYAALRFRHQHITWRAHPASAVQPKSPGILIISLPRSGSSWVGSILGAAGNAIYLREPLNQSYLAAGGNGTVFPVDDTRLPPGYADAARAAFLAQPTFDTGIAPHPQQWTGGDRNRRRVVVKEVNPFVCDWLARAYRPRIVLLLRHPAAIAQSYHRLGWDLSYAPLGIDPKESFWIRHGDFQARTLKHVLAFSARYQDIKVVRYEDICADPVAQFRALFDYGQIAWDGDIEQRIRRQSTSNDDPSSYATSRFSNTMAGSWRQSLSPVEIANVRRGYSRQILPWYQTDADWDGIRSSGEDKRRSSR